MWNVSRCRIIAGSHIARLARVRVTRRGTRIRIIAGRDLISVIIKVRITIVVNARTFHDRLVLKDPGSRNRIDLNSKLNRKLIANRQ